MWMTIKHGSNLKTILTNQFQMFFCEINYFEQGCSQCCALHGLSLVVTATNNGKTKTMLFDAGSLVPPRALYAVIFFYNSSIFYI